MRGTELPMATAYGSATIARLSQSSTEAASNFQSPGLQPVSSSSELNEHRHLPRAITADEL